MQIIIADSNMNTLNAVAQDRRMNMAQLCSYWYCRDKNVEPVYRFFRTVIENKKSLYLDSGVFSARKSNTIISAKELIEFVQKNRQAIDYVFTMDEGIPEEQYRNLLLMKRAEMPVIPIYHGTMPLDYIKRFTDIQPYFVISFFWTKGVINSKKVIDYLDQIFSYLHKNNLDHIPVHALGTLAKCYLEKFPFYSVDSTTPTGCMRFGAAMVFKHGNIVNGRGNSRQAFNSVGPILLAMKKRGNTAVQCMKMLTIIEQLKKYQDYLTKLWAQRGIVWDEKEIRKSTR